MIPPSLRGRPLVSSRAARARGCFGWGEEHGRWVWRMLLVGDTPESEDMQPFSYSKEAVWIGDGHMGRGRVPTFLHIIFDYDKHIFYRE